MKKIILLSFLMLLQIQLLKSQSISIKSGRNLSYYHFSNSGEELVQLKNETGSTYEFGYISDLPLNKKLHFGASLGLEEYNASGSFQTSQLEWNTTYINLKGLGYYALHNNDTHRLALKAGLGLATMAHGRQFINGVRYDLLKQEEFKGLFISPQLGLAYSFLISNDINLHLDYDYGYQYNLSNRTNQKLYFINHTLSLGFSVNL